MMRWFPVVAIALGVSLGGCDSDVDAPAAGKATPVQGDAPQEQAKGADATATAKPPEPPAPPAAPEPQPAMLGERPLPAPKAGMVWAIGTVNNLAGRAARPRGPKDMAQICVHGHAEIACVDTDEKGQYAIEVPAASEVALVFRGEFLTPTLRAFMTTDQNIQLGNSRVPNEKGLSPIAKASNKRLRKRAGTLFFGGSPGTTTWLEPKSGDLFYIGFRNELLPDAKAVPMHGTGGYFNVKPGIVRVRFERPGSVCSYRPENTFSGWPDPQRKDVARVPVMAGHVTHLVTMGCVPPTSAPSSEASHRPPQ